MNRIRFRSACSPIVPEGDFELSPKESLWDYNFKVLCPRLNLLFNDVPKNYSSTIKSMLYSIEKQGRLNSDFHRFIPYRIWVKEFPEMVVDWDKIAWRTYFKFAFLRNPYARLLSSYFNRGWKFYYEDLSFPQFVSHLPELINDPNAKVHISHHIPFSVFIPRVNGKLYLDFLGKCENFEEDFSEVLYAAGIRLPIKFPVINPSKQVSYQDYFDRESKEIAEKIYGEDIELGKYRF